MTPASLILHGPQVIVSHQLILYVSHDHSEEDSRPCITLFGPGQYQAKHPSRGTRGAT